MLKTRDWDRLGNGGLRLTELGLGTAPLANLYRAITADAARAVFDAAWAGGVRYYDTAPLYGLGLSETRLNPFLKDKPRDAYVLSSKVGRLLHPCPPDERTGIGKWFEVPCRREHYDYSYDGIMRSFAFSLERLGVDRIDILYVHDLDPFNHEPDALAHHRAELMGGGLRALEELRAAGTIRAFGAGLNTWQDCQWMAERADMDLFLLAGRYTLLEQGALDSFLPLAQARSIGVVIGGPYNSGILATGARPGAWYNYEPAPQSILDSVARIEAVCGTHSVRLVDAAFQFPLRHPAVLSVIPGGQGTDEMASNLAAATAQIPDALWSDLKSLGLLSDAAPI